MSTSTSKLAKKFCELDLSNPENVDLYRQYRPEVVPPKQRGEVILHTASICKGLSFSLRERQQLGLHGLLPAAIMTQEQQAFRVLNQLRQEPNDLARYILLDALQHRDEKLFYRVISDHVKELMPIVYTPTVGLACQHYGFIYRNPKGIYITINDNSMGQIYQIFNNWPHSDIRAIVVTDGERILGLGDLGAYGIGIPIGKLALYVALAGVQPSWCLPVVLDVGTDNQALLDDPYYIGLRRKRVRGEEYDLFVDNFMRACVKKFGRKTLIQFEDFGNRNAYRFLEKYRNEYCMFNDDIQGTACIVLAGFLSAAKILKKPLSEGKYLFLGAGEAATGVADLIVDQMMSEGLTLEQARDRIYLINSKGIITKQRPNPDPRHDPYAKEAEPCKDLHELVRHIRPTALVGLSTVGGAFTAPILEEMARINERPIIFALSNPTNRAECTAEEAYRHTDGKAIFACGSPFKEVHYNGQTFVPGQGNNAYVFPGISLGVVLFKLSTVQPEVFLHAARTVANMVDEEDLQKGCLFPDLTDVRELSVQIALEIGEESYKNGTAKRFPEPINKELFIRSQIYDFAYSDMLAPTYDWPEEDMKPHFVNKKD